MNAIYKTFEICAELFVISTCSDTPFDHLSEGKTNLFVVELLKNIIHSCRTLRCCGDEGKKNIFNNTLTLSNQQTMHDINKNQGI